MTIGRQEHEGVLNKDCRGSQGVAVTLTALTGKAVRCGESQWHIPHKPPKRGGGAHDAQGLLLRRVGKDSLPPDVDPYCLCPWP